MSPMIVTKKHLSRRTVLRGLGVTMALPFLDAMVPALAAMDTLPRSSRRLGIVYAPNGMNMWDWTPKTEGAAFELSPIMQPLAPFRDRMLVLSGLDSNAADQI